MSNPNLHYDKVRWQTVDIVVLHGHKDLKMAFHTMSRALGYDKAGEKILVPWHECQKTYHQVTDTTKPTNDNAKPGPHPALTAYGGFTEKQKTFWSKIIQEGLRRADYAEIMVELRDAKMSTTAKNLKRAELKEQERATRRMQWLEIVPGAKADELAQEIAWDALALRKAFIRK